MDNIDKRMQDLLDYLKVHTVDEVDWGGVESLTSNIIIDDKYEELPENIQDAVELFDSWELNNPNEKDRLQSILLLNGYLDKKSNPEE